MWFPLSPGLWWEEVESNHRSRIFSPAHRPRMSSSPMASFSSHEALILCKMLDSNQESLAYEASELPFLYLAIYNGQFKSYPGLYERK